MRYMEINTHLPPPAFSVEQCKAVLKHHMLMATPNYNP